MITLGDIVIDKTFTINQIKDKEFKKPNKASVGNNCSIKKKYELKKILILFNFQKTKGQERDLNIIPLNNIPNSHVVFLVFSELDTLAELKNSDIIIFIKEILNKKFKISWK